MVISGYASSYEASGPFCKQYVLEKWFYNTITLFVVLVSVSYTTRSEIRLKKKLCVQHNYHVTAFLLL